MKELELDLIKKSIIDVKEIENKIEELKKERHNKITEKENILDNVNKEKIVEDTAIKLSNLTESEKQIKGLREIKEKDLDNTAKHLSSLLKLNSSEYLELTTQEDIDKGFIKRKIWICKRGFYIQFNYNIRKSKIEPYRFDYNYGIYLKEKIKAKLKKKEDKKQVDILLNFLIESKKEKSNNRNEDKSLVKLEFENPQEIILDDGKKSEVKFIELKKHYYYSDFYLAFHIDENDKVESFSSENVENFIRGLDQLIVFNKFSVQINTVLDNGLAILKKRIDDLTENKKEFNKILLPYLVMDEI